MSIRAFIKKNPVLDPFFKKIERKITKASSIRGLLFIGINSDTGKIILYKGYLLTQMHYLGTITDKAHCEDLRIFLYNIGVPVAEETVLPDIFLNMPFSFYILNAEQQNKLKF